MGSVLDEQPPAGAASEPSFDELFEAYAAFVWRALKRLGVPPGDVADASQEVFLVVHRRLASFEARSSVRSWIYGICLKVASSWRRKAQQRGTAPLSEPVEEPASGAVGLDDELERRRTRALLVAALEQLDEDKRDVFVLYELEELSMSEVADAVGCPLTTAYSRLHAARKQVRAAFARTTLLTSRAG